MNKYQIANNVRGEIARIDSTMRTLTANPNWLGRVSRGQPKNATSHAMVNLSEELRRAQLVAKAGIQPEYAKAKNFFEKCYTVKSRANNIETIENAVAKYRADSVDAGYIFEPTLTNMDPNRYYVAKQALGRWQGLIPTMPVSIGAEETKYTMRERTGALGRSGPGSHGGVNFVGVKSSRFSNPIRTKNVGYEFTTDDARKAAFSGEPFMDDLILAAQEAKKGEIENLVWLGDTVEGIKGLFNSADVPTIQSALPNPLGTSDRTWTGPDKTTDNIFADINAAASQIAANSGENYRPEDTVFNLIMTRNIKKALNKRMAAGTDTTLIQFIRNNVDAGIGRIDVIPELAGQGQGGSEAVFMYPNDPKVFRFRINPEIIWQPMQFVDLTMKVPGQLIHGFVEIIYAFAMIKIWGV